MYSEIQARHEVLLDTKLTHVERVSEILSVQQQVHFPIHRNHQFAGHDIVSGFHFVLAESPPQFLSQDHHEVQ